MEGPEGAGPLGASPGWRGDPHLSSLFLLVPSAFQSNRFVRLVESVNRGLPVLDQLRGRDS